MPYLPLDLAAPVEPIPIVLMSSAEEVAAVERHEIMAAFQGLWGSNESYYTEFTHPSLHGPIMPITFEDPLERQSPLFPHPLTLEVPLIRDASLRVPPPTPSIYPDDAEQAPMYKVRVHLSASTSTVHRIQGEEEESEFNFHAEWTGEARSGECSAEFEVEYVSGDRRVNDEYNNGDLNQE